MNIDTKPTAPVNTSALRQTRTANTYGGTSTISGTGGGNRSITAVKSTITSNGNATIHRSLQPQQQQQQQTVNDDQMVFGQATVI